MSQGPNNIPCSEGLQDYYPIPANSWPEVEPSQFVGLNHAYCTEPLVPPTVLTPNSLPDNTMRPSPALSHHAHEYIPDYQYINRSMPTQGLGITAPFPSEYPRTSAPNSTFLYGPASPQQHNMIQTPGRSPAASPNNRINDRVIKRTRAILPNPNGMNRELKNVAPLDLPKKRASSRGRRDPQAEEEDAFVESLRNQNVAWKRVREEYSQRFHKDASEARLQMRLLRRQRERTTHWDKSDIQLLIRADDMWEKEKYHFIAMKMEELGATKPYTADQCQAQLRLLKAKQEHRDRLSFSPSASAISDPAPNTPTMSRKRLRAQSFEPGLGVEIIEPFF